jgi:hypothetical protein
MDLKNCVWGCELGLSGSERGTVMDCCEHGNACSGFIKTGAYWTNCAVINFSRTVLCRVVRATFHP